MTYINTNLFYLGLNIFRLNGWAQIADVMAQTNHYGVGQPLSTDFKINQNQRPESSLIIFET